jgi:hypothetical protein
MEYEAAATELDVYNSSWVPDFLSTTAYAQSLENTFAQFKSHPDEAQMALRAQLRRDRAAYLLGPDGPGLRIIIDEMVFYRPIGGEQRPPEERYNEVTAIIRGLQRLNSVGKNDQPAESQLNPNVSVQIAPALIWALPRGGYPFSVVSTDGQPVAVHTDWSGGETNWFSDTEVPNEYQADFADLSRRIPDTAKTNAILDDVLTAIHTDEPIMGVSIAQQYL